MYYLDFRASFISEGTSVVFRIRVRMCAWQHCGLCLQVVAPFEVSLLGVDMLELRVTVLDSNTNVHSVWVDPVLTVCAFRFALFGLVFLHSECIHGVLQECEDWLCGGWRNDKSVFVDALSGTKRGQVCLYMFVHGVNTCCVCYMP